MLAPRSHPQVAHSWRTTFDIHPNWPSLLQNLDESVGLARYAGPGSWNDLDLLEVGGWLAVAA
jgi:alpha-galactosidase